MFWRAAAAAAICCTPVVLAAAADPPPPVDVVRLDAEQTKRVDLVSQEVSADGRDLTIVLKPKDEKFTVDFELPAAADYRHLKIVVRGAKNSNTMRFFPNFKRGLFVDLASLRGVNVDQKANDCVIEFFSQKAIAILAPGGRLLFHSEYTAPVEIKNKK